MKGRKRTKIYQTVFLTFSIMMVLSGCSGLDKAREQVKMDNERTEQVLKYKKETDKYLPVMEDVIRDSISKGYIEGLDKTEIKLAGTVDIDILREQVGAVKESFDYMIDLYKDDLKNIDEKDESIQQDYIDKLKRITSDPEKELENSIEVYPFLDASTGKIEQYFLIELDNGQTYKFSINWLGGSVISVEKGRY